MGGDYRCEKELDNYYWVRETQERVQEEVDRESPTGRNDKAETGVEMGEEEQEEFRAALNQLREELESSLIATLDSAKTVDLDQPIGRLSRMDAIQQQKMATAGRRNTEVRLAQVRSALAALGEGLYGECRRCEEEISLPRLRVRPEAPFCLSCQRLSETR